MKDKRPIIGCQIFCLIVMIIVLVFACTGRGKAESEQLTYLPVIQNWRPTPDVSIIFDGETGMVDIDVIDPTCLYIDVNVNFLYSVSRACSYLGWMYYPSAIDELVIYVHYPERIVPVTVECPGCDYGG